jgi:two-component system NtrC family response regulator
MAVEAMKNEAFDYLQKPINLDELEMLVKRALDQRRLVSENRELRKQLEARFNFSEIVSQSKEMEEVLNKAGRVAKTDATVLLRGESGTGKELFARAIHFTSLRKDKPFVVVNCAALPETLIESELFGHEKGAFTGAEKQRIGRFEEAHTGTLFIDEIGDVPLQVQVKLLRVLQSGELQRLGGNQTLHSDVRIVAATNRDLEEMIKEGTFREDLYYRLNVIGLTIPPLRKRKSDIHMLLDHFFYKYSQQYKQPIKTISRDALDLLIKYDFPGNVRELEHLVERALVLSRDDLVGVDDLPVNIRNLKSEESLKREIRTESLNEQLEAYEQEIILATLQKTDGNQRKAAILLGISERNLRYKLEKLKGDTSAKGKN